MEKKKGLKLSSFSLTGRWSSNEPQALESENHSPLSEMGNITSWSVTLVKMGIPWERCCWEQSTCSHSRQCLSEQNIIRNKDDVGHYGNRLPVGEPSVCSALGGHTCSLWRGDSMGKQQDWLLALTPVGHRRIFCLRECVVLSCFL